MFLTSPSFSDRPLTGYIDIHAHLLPGVDDGCRSVEEAVACVRRLQELGYAGSVCTPHLLPSFESDFGPDQVEPKVAELQEDLRRHGLDYQLWPGGELHIRTGTLAWVEQVGLRPLGPGRCVLCDTWLEQWTDEADALIDHIHQAGYRVVLAHPERLPAEDLDGLLDHLADRGVWFQGNFNSLSGGEGPLAYQRALQMLRQGRYHCLAMDLHRIDNLDSRIEGFHTAAAMLGPEKLAELLCEQPLRMLAGEITS